MREATNLQAAKPIKQFSGKEIALNRLGDCVVPEKRPASGGHMTKKKETVTFNTSNVSDAIADIFHLIKYFLPVTMSPGPENGNPYGDNRMAAILQAMVDKTASAKFDSIEFEIRLYQTLNDILSSPDTS